ncbi:MAG: DNA repair protein RadC [Alistipes sp.]
MKNSVDKLLSRGATALTDCELLSLLIEDEVLATSLLSAVDGSLSAFATEDIARLRMREGLGLRRAQRLVVAIELGRRIATESAQQVVSIATSDDVVALFRPQLENLQHEECWAVYLTASNRILERQQVSSGGVQGTVVDHRLIVKRALELLATQLILVHNHPSGAAEPSPQDKTLTEKIAAAAALFDLRLLDHIILARAAHFSFRQAGLL